MMIKINKANKRKYQTTILMFWIFTNFLMASDTILKTEDIRIRDPFIYAEQQGKTYYMYAQAANREGSNKLYINYIQCVFIRQ